MTSKSSATSSPHSPADTLRAMAKDLGFSADLSGGAPQARFRRDQAACEAGAAAWEIVVKLGAIVKDGHLRLTDENWDALCDVLDEARTLVNGQ